MLSSPAQAQSSKPDGQKSEVMQVQCQIANRTMGIKKHKPGLKFGIKIAIFNFQSYI